MATTTGDVKTFKPHSHVPFGSDGSGFYSDNTIGCFNVVRAASPTTLKALESAISKIKRYGKTFAICDYGTADGGTSMFLIKDCVEYLIQNVSDVEVLVYYEDQPVNDFKSLFMRLHGLIPGPPSYLAGNDKVFVSAVGTGFYDQCLPSDTVHLGFSATAMHWLTKRPCVLTNSIHHTSCKDQSEIKLFKEQAARDWEQNLSCRAKELASGAQMVIVCFTVDKDGQYLGHSNTVKANMYERMTFHWKSMAEEGKITTEEFNNTTFNNYYRSEEEYSAPFLNKNSVVYKAGLRLVSIETKLVRCPYHEKWLKEGKNDDEAARKAHAKWIIPTTRTWSNYTFKSALSDSRTEQEKDDLVDELFKRYENDIALNPSDHAIDYVHAYIHIEKV